MNVLIVVLIMGAFTSWETCSVSYTVFLVILTDKLKHYHPCIMNLIEQLKLRLKFSSMKLLICSGLVKAIPSNWIFPNE